MIDAKAFRASAVLALSLLAGLLVLRANPSTTLTGIAAVILVALTVLNLRFGKTLLYPPAMFCAVWSLLLACLFLSGSYFYPVSWQTLTFYILGAAAFSLGGLANRSVAPLHPTPMPPTPRDRLGWINGILTLGLIIFLAGIPFYWNYAQELASTSYLSNINTMWALRDALIQSGQQLGVKPFSQFVFDSLSGFSILIVFVATLEPRTSRFQKWRYYLLVGIALLYNLGTAGRVGAFFEVVGLAILTAFRRGGINFKLVGKSALAFLLAFTPAAIMMNKGGDATWSPWQNIAGISQSILDYSLAGVVAFDRIIQNPDAISPVWRISRSILQMASRMGLDVYVPSIHAEFSAIRPGLDGNAYSMYFAYLPDFGWFGTMLLVFCLGAAVTWIYRRAAEGNRVFAMLLGLFGSYILLSGYNEGFFTQLNFNLKCLGVGWACYAMPLPWARKQEKRALRSGLQRANSASPLAQTVRLTSK